MKKNEVRVGMSVLTPDKKSGSQWGNGRYGTIEKIDGNLVYVRCGFNNGSGFCSDIFQYTADQLKPA